MAAVAVNFADLAITVRALAGIAFLVITAPVAAHLIGRAAYREGVPLWKTTIDEWRSHPQAPPQPSAPGDKR
jgi:multicomponent Na+:H+ antiporter subunit G